VVSGRFKDIVQEMAKQKKLGKFFLFGPTFRGGDHGLELENEKDFLAPGRVTLGPPVIGGFGFPPFPRVPQLKPDKQHYDRPPKDLEQFDHYWLVSQRLKDVMQATDAEGVEFADCDVYHISGKPIEPKHYLCDVVRALDAVDESASDIRTEFEEG
jgi:hypothetical protein